MQVYTGAHAHTHAQKSHGEKNKHTGSISICINPSLSYFKKKKVERKGKL